MYLDAIASIYALTDVFCNLKIDTPSPTSSSRHAPQAAMLEADNYDHYHARKAIRDGDALKLVNILARQPRPRDFVEAKMADVTKAQNEVACHDQDCYDCFCPSALHAGRSTGAAPRGSLHEGRSTGGSQIFFILTCAQY